MRKSPFSKHLDLTLFLWVLHPDVQFNFGEALRSGAAYYRQITGRNSFFVSIFTFINVIVFGAKAEKVDSHLESFSFKSKKTSQSVSLSSHLENMRQKRIYKN